ncbi:hypothetical protein [Opitutus sp. GAS368]|uniref:hypothetical protein n=1 Tax=Opitutus sp. GAS368 TaxID=1882749 RepID=UPI000879974B|nr:hypothetical protein [Opitutus sp. GAS368]SDR76001.1 hypothetical protein SAMN05444173_0766 [Opitutus sp. GAS368]
MKSFARLGVLLCLAPMLVAQTTQPSVPAKLTSAVYDWEKMPVTPTPKSVRRDVFDGRTHTAGPGSVFFLATNAVTRLRNAGPTPATYIVFSYHTR